jgi:hypothetical protein
MSTASVFLLIFLTLCAVEIVRQIIGGVNEHRQQQAAIKRTAYLHTLAALYSDDLPS